jgi:hypothetical protein
MVINKVFDEVSKKLKSVTRHAQKKRGVYKKKKDEKFGL